jgi:hypothetical protein
MELLTENQLKWVEALESDEFQQSTGSLANGDGYCCLGVACEIAMRNGVEVDKTSDLGSDIITYDDYWADLPRSVRIWLDVDSGNPVVDDGVEAMSCSYMNDQEGMSFEAIASRIRLYGFTTRYVRLDLDPDPDPDPDPE